MSKIDEINSKGYGSVDLEMHEAINKLNTVPGMATFDCCFGHPGEGRRCNHHSHFFIGLVKVDTDKFDKFWQTFFDKWRGKPQTPVGYVQFVLTVGLYGCYAGLRLDGLPEHDPGVDDRGNREKKWALQLLCDFVDEYLNV